MECRHKKLGEEIKELSDGQLRSDKLYLYYTQMGRSMYTGRPICLGSLMAGADYDIDHIYPRSATGDDSLDNRVLVERTENAKRETIILYLLKYKGRAVLESTFR